MLVNSKQLLLDAKRGGYAIPSTNIFNLNSLKGVLKAAEENRSPLIISLAEVHTESLSIGETANIVNYYANKTDLPIVLHFDHGFTPSLVKQAINKGFTSVMIDGSSLPFDENVKITKEIVTLAHEKNVTVEAEIGHVGGGESYTDPEDDHSQLTTVEEAKRFAKLTNVDSLAVSIGTAHGTYRGTPKIDFERLSQINQAVDIPLVLHGGSGSGSENLRKAVELGICKVNIFTDLTIAAHDKLVDNFKDINYYDACLLAEEGIKECLLNYYSIFKTKRGM
ncbi:class II fructose-bisphosphate aldolase [Anaerosalibacter massiliensis]|uniref:Class II fructose-bisphosphate aldolase n=1 Tax=Anaerosalibacter massiliensis TaxID=1347392 RepID=A0A9X2MJS0_9FIRM|nr:class II fructose-bisphosphate aldolase [Anaerosalibacter massiliensis]MCR2044899.1 class II fructose-bisphosphate aldolase [Anaerosalibacter massiliensis]